MATSINQQSLEAEPNAVTTRRVVTADIVVQFDGWTDMPNLEGVIQEAVGVVGCADEIHRQLEGQDVSTCSVSIVLSDDDAVHQLNKTHRNLDKPTNVLSFPSGPMAFPLDEDGARYLGDVVIAHETIVKEAAELERTVSDHLTHLVIHGLLHVLGYDHETETDAQKMEQLEISILSRLGIANPYEDGF